MARKYVVFQTETGHEFAVTFPREIVHAEVARGIGSQRHEIAGRCHAVRAGFYDRDGVPYGRSESLNMDSHPADADLIASYALRPAAPEPVEQHTVTRGPNYNVRTREPAHDTKSKSLRDRFRKGKLK